MPGLKRQMSQLYTEDSIQNCFAFDAATYSWRQDTKGKYSPVRDICDDRRYAAFLLLRLLEFAVELGGGPGRG
jgi:hypothetical protein